jgi:hypothetical protein
MSAESPTQNLSAAYELLKQWTDIGHADVLDELGPAAIYKSSVVLWMMLFQRLNPEASLRDAVLHFIETAPEELKTNKRLREGRLATGSSSYSDARHRINLETVKWFEQQVSSSIINSTAPSFNNQRVFLIDGTTFSLAPVAELQKCYPPASNQYGEGVWPIAYVVVAHELSSGASVPPEVGAMYGKHAVSETYLARALMKKLPPNSIIMADAGYGIYSVAHHAKECGHDFVLRMTKERFNRVKKSAQLINSTDTSKTYEVQWKPSPKERASNPELPADCWIAGRLHDLLIGEEHIYIVESVCVTAQQVGGLYWQRNDVEVDIRNIKVVIDTEHMQAKSQEMFLKEFSISMVAYNLTTQLRRQAAELAHLDPRDLSFTGVWSVYRHMLQGIEVRNVSEWHDRFDRAIKYASQQKLPKRPGRSYTRESYARRPKSSHFKKRKKPEKLDNPPPPEPK